MMFSLRAKGKLKQKRTPLLSWETRKATTTITTTTTKNLHFIKKLYIINNNKQSVEEALEKYYTNCM